MPHFTNVPQTPVRQLRNTSSMRRKETERETERVVVEGWGGGGVKTAPLHCNVERK